jgi:hypothetical protein
MKLHAHGIDLTLPPGWSGRVFSPDPRAATVHAGNFTLAVDEDSTFGSGSTAAMRPGASFVALAEYVPGGGLEPGTGLFASHRIPLPLDPARFSSAALARPQARHVGMQHFFTTSGRPFCLYVVLDGDRAQRRAQLAIVDHVLRSVRIERRA